MTYCLCPSRPQAGWLVLRGATCDLCPQLQLSCEDEVAQVKPGQAPWPAQGQRHTGLGRTWGMGPAGGAGLGLRSKMQLEAVTRAGDTNSLFLKPPAPSSWRTSAGHRSNRHPCSGTQTCRTPKNLLEKVRWTPLASSGNSLPREPIFQ